MHCFWDIRLVSIKVYSDLETRVRVTQGHRNRHTYRSATYRFLLTFHSNHGPISYRFRDKRRFRSKIAIFPSVNFAPRWRSSSWNLVLALGFRKLEWWGYLAEKEVWRYLQPCGYNPLAWQGQTDGHRTTAKTALRIASRGNKILSNNNNNNNHDDIYSAVIMTRSLREFTRFIWWM